LFKAIHVFRKTDKSDYSSQFIHALFIRDMRIAFSPDKQDIVKQFFDLEIPEEIFFLESPFDVDFDLFP